MLKETAAKLPPEQLEKNFADINPPLTASQALEAGSRCLFCHDAPCIKACPTGIDIPMFIKQILTNNLKGSAKTILDANMLGHSCGRVCPTSVLCEGACVLNAEGKQPVEIGRLQRHAVDYVLDNNITLYQPGAPNGMKVALIGGGPASLSCAAELRKQGYGATIFDAHPEPGGLNTYGIAAYKMKAREAVRETEMIRHLGVEFRQNVEVGKTVTLAQLEKDYDAIFIGVGLGQTDALGIPGEELAGCRDALTFIEETKTKEFGEVEVGKRV
ncbi:MAG: FAD-dependent oxidoreductase, partial [Terriglobales bacterium]